MKLDGRLESHGKRQQRSSCNQINTLPSHHVSWASLLQTLLPSSIRHMGLMAAGGRRPSQLPVAFILSGKIQFLSSSLACLGSFQCADGLLS